MLSLVPIAQVFLCFFNETSKACPCWKSAEEIDKLARAFCQAKSDVICVCLKAASEEGLQQNIPPGLWLQWESCGRSVPGQAAGRKGRRVRAGGPA